MKKIRILFPIVLVLFFVNACNVDQTEQGELPEMDVDVEEGNLPEYDVDWMNVDVSTRTKMVEVPEVTVTMEEKQVEVPVVDVNMPDDSLQVERTLRVETEVADEMRKLEIEEVYATENKLYVISELETTGESLQGNAVRVSDQIILNAPEDLVVKHYIVGEKPERGFNDGYTYISSRDDISGKMQNGKTIWSR